MSTQRPADCPAGLWEVLCGILRDPSEFLRDNPEVYEECKAEWRRVPRKPVDSVRASPPPHPRQGIGTLAECIHEHADRIGRAPTVPFWSELRGCLLRAAESVDRNDHLLAARDLYRAVTILLDKVHQAPGEEKVG